MLFTRTLAALLAVSAPAFALSHKGGRTTELAERNIEICAEGLFWWPVKEICLTIGGRTAPAYPPGGKSCPNEWQYHSGYSCCVPTHSQAPTPSQGSQCSNGWPWSQDDLCCNDPSPRSNPPPAPVPSGRFHSGGHNKLRRAGKRSLDCPVGLKACSIGFHMGDFECIDPLHDLNSCGGCVTAGDVGQDCSAIVGSKSVGCDAGKCQVFECLAGFVIGDDGASCLKA